MAYATVEDAILMYGEGTVVVCCDRNLDGALDTSSFQSHLDNASSQMDAFLLGRYPLPLTTNGIEVPGYFKQACVDIALYNATPTADVATLQIKTRRDDAIALLTMIAKNTLKLGLAAPEAGAAGNAAYMPQTAATGTAGSACSVGCAPCDWPAFAWCGERIDFGGIL